MLTNNRGSGGGIRRLSDTSGLARLRGRPAALWTGVLLVGIFDVLLTHHGLGVGFVELNPIARVNLALFGTWSLVGVKLLAVGMGIASWRALRRRRHIVPAVYLVCWGAAALSNAVMIANAA